MCYCIEVHPTLLYNRKFLRIIKCVIVVKFIPPYCRMCNCGQWTNKHTFFEGLINFFSFNYDFNNFFKFTLCALNQYAGIENNENYVELYRKAI